MYIFKAVFVSLNPLLFTQKTMHHNGTGTITVCDVYVDYLTGLGLCSEIFEYILFSRKSSLSNLYVPTKVKKIEISPDTQYNNVLSLVF